jgi:hypothetical protein
MPNDPKFTSEPLSISRPDKETEEIIENAVRIAMEIGMTAAEAYLQLHNVNKRTALRVLSQDTTVRRKPR